MKPIATAPTEASLLASFPFVLNFNHPYVQVRLNGSAPLWFILDTGAQVMVIDRDTAEQIGLTLQPVEGTAAGAGAETLDLAIANDLTLNLHGFEARFDVAYVTPINPVLAPHEGRNVHGLLGFDFMSRNVVEMDHAGGVIRLHDPATYDYTGRGTVVPLTLENNHPRVRATLLRSGADPIEGTFVIDTGATGPVYLATPFVNAHGLLTSGMPTRSGFVAGVGGLSEQPVGRIGALRFGDLTVEYPLVYFSQDEAGGFAGLLGADGIIGTEILRRYTVVWDYPHRRVILEPNNHHDEPFTHDIADLSGLYLMADGADLDTIRVAHVVAGGSAETAGIRAGDVILTIDGEPAAQLTLEHIRRLFLHEKTYRLRIQRRDEVVDVTLPLKRSL